jgi:tetratricopeptide (TPR) repeat protein
MEFERRDPLRKRKRIVLARGPFAVLVGFVFVLGLLVGGFLALSLDPFHVKLTESPFGPDRTSRLPKGHAFDGLDELEDLPSADREKYLTLLRLDAEGKRDEAQALGNALAAAHPDDALVAPTAAYLHLRRYPGHARQDGAGKAAELLAKAEAARPDGPWLNYVAGLLHERAGRPDSARARYIKAIKASPQFAYPHAALGRLQLERGETGLAAPSLRKAIGLMVTSPERYRLGPATALPGAEAAPFDWLATLYVQAGAPDSARMALEYGLEKGWKTDRMDLVQGWLWEGGGFLNKADSLYRRLVASDPGEPEYVRALATLGWKPSRATGGSNGKSGADAAFALSILDPLARQNPKNGALWMALGQAYYHRGLYAMATESFDSSLKADPALPGLAQKRDLAWQALVRETALQKARGGEELVPKISPEVARRAAEESTPVVLPGAIALLGTYSVPWGSSAVEVRQAYPGKTFRNMPGGDLLDEFMHDGVKHEYLLAFKEGKLWAIRIFVTDSAGVGGDLFGRLIRTKTKISGEGKGTGEAACPGFLPFQGAIWETDDTFEFMAQFSGKENQIRLVRMDRAQLPHNRRLCDLVPYLKTETWDKK